MPYILKLVCKNGDACVRSALKVSVTITSGGVREARAEARKLGWRFEKGGMICTPCYLQRELTREPKRQKAPFPPQWHAVTRF